MRKIKKFLLPAAAVLMILAAGMVLYPALTAPKLPPAELAAVAVDNLLSADSLTFQTESKLLLNNEITPLGKLNGEICGENYHIQGEVLGSRVNIYQLGQRTLRQDTLTEQWLDLADGEMLTNQSLLGDLDPRTVFHLTAILDATAADTEDIDGEKCFKLGFTPQTADGYYEKYFDDLACTLWVNAQNQIRRAEICATAHAGSQSSTLTLTCNFSDYNATPEIVPPVVDANQQQPAA